MPFYTKKRIPLNEDMTVGYRSPAGAAGFGLIGHEYDGTNDYLDDNGSGLPQFGTDSKLFSGSIWMFAPAANNNADSIFSGSNARVQLIVTGTENIRLNLKTAGGVDVGQWSASGDVITGGWHHFACAVDAGNTIYQAYFDGVDQSASWTNTGDQIMSLSVQANFCATISGVSKVNLRLSQVWLKTGINVDLDTNLNDFWGDGTPPDGGIDGTTFGHGEPEIWLPKGNEENGGSAIDFTVVGALTEVAGPGA